MPPPSRMRPSAAARGSARLEDAALVHAVLVRDPSAAPAIVRRYGQLVRRWLGGSLSGADVDDHVQEVFARCFERLPQLRTPGSLRSFIIGITLRFAGSERRRRRRKWWEMMTLSGDLPEAVASDTDVESREAAWRTRDVLARLKPESRRLLELRFVQERELSEIAASMGISLATAKRQVARASARVRAMVHGEQALAEYLRSPGCDAESRQTGSANGALDAHAFGR